MLNKIAELKFQPGMTTIFRKEAFGFRNNFAAHLQLLIDPK